MFAPQVAVVARYTYRELADTTRRRFMDLVHPALIRRVNLPSDGGGELEWKAGGVTLFRNLDDPHKYQSLEAGQIAIDEVTECPELVWNMCESRCGRCFTGERRGTYAPIYGTGNPNGRDWIDKLFFGEKHDQTTHAGFAPNMHENEDALPPGYYDNLSKGKPDWWIRRFIKGEAAALEGLVWPSFDFDVHVVDDFRLPTRWNRITGHDHGRRNPTACMWLATDEEGNIIVYREYQLAGPTPPEHCMNILKLERGESISERHADPSMFAKSIPWSSGRWRSVADEYEEAGIILTPASNIMQATLDRVDSLLYCDPQRPYPAWHKRAGSKGSPRIFFFKSCEETVDAISSWKYKEHGQAQMGLREEPVDVNDHLPDCLRYATSSMPEASPRMRPVKEPTPADWQIERRKMHWKHVVRNLTQPHVTGDYA